MAARRRRATLGTSLVVLVVAVISLWSRFVKQSGFWAQPVSGPEAVSLIKAPDGKAYGSRYYYAGMPRPQPGYPFAITPLVNIGYAVGYCEQRKDPVWVCYAVFRAKGYKGLKRSTIPFVEDDRTKVQVFSSDYTDSGYDRGHMAPNRAIALCYGPDAARQAFRMSNIVPQKHDFNAGIWERLESREIEYAPEFAVVWVVTGPIFGGKPMTLRSGVEIPSACYKILVDEDGGRIRLLPFIIGQDEPRSTRLDRELTSVDEIQKETGLDFFAELPDELERQLESAVPKSLW